MGKKRISRKEFLTRTISGVAGLSIISKNNIDPSSSLPLRALGKTDIMVSPICFGAPRTNEESLIKYAIEQGLNYIDTGRTYGNGNNESLVGRAVSGIRNKVVIQSKIRLDRNELQSLGQGNKAAGQIRSALSSKLEASLKALNTDYIDIMLYHDANSEDLLFHKETLKFFSEMKRSGVIKAHGFSTHNDTMNLPERNNSERFYDVIMLPFNHKGSFIHTLSGEFSEWDQEKLISILSEAKKRGIGVIAMKTCSGGKYSAPGREPDFSQAVSWVINHDFISSAAVAMANFEQVNEHLSTLKK